MTWRIAHRGEYGDSEWVAIKGRYQCAIPLFEEKSRKLARLIDIVRNWKGTWIESAQSDVIKVAEGYFEVNPEKCDFKPSFRKLDDPRPHCSLRRVS